MSSQYFNWILVSRSIMPLSLPLSTGVASSSDSSIGSCSTSSLSLPFSSTEAALKWSLVKTNALAQEIRLSAQLEEVIKEYSALDGASNQRQSRLGNVGCLKRG